MSAASLTTLPPPPPDRTGWPWTEQTPPATECPAPGRAWPPISIVVPVLNQGGSLEAALRSVLLQGYPDLEIIIIDGGSTDGTLDVLRKYEPWLGYWVSEPDRGQTHAINKGLVRCNGEVANWVCGDDLLVPGALQAIGRAFARAPETDVVVGRTEHKFLSLPSRNRIDPPPSLGRIRLIPATNPIAQPSCFYRRRLLDRDPPLDESLEYSMDLELWAYFNSRGARWKTIDDVLSVYQYTGRNKTMNGGEHYLEDGERIYHRYVRERVPLTWWYRRFRNPIDRAWMRSHNPFFRALLLIPEALYIVALGPFYGFRRTALWYWRWIYDTAGHDAE